MNLATQQLAEWDDLARKTLTRPPCEKCGGEGEVSGYPTSRIPVTCPVCNGQLMPFTVAEALLSNATLLLCVEVTRLYALADDFARASIGNLTVDLGDPQGLAAMHHLLDRELITCQDEVVQRALEHEKHMADLNKEWETRNANPTHP